MPAQPAHPNFSQASVETLEAAIKQATSKKLYLRLKAIYDLACTNKTKREIAADLNISLRTLQRWLKRFNEAGIEGLVDKPKSGRNRCISAEAATQITQLVDNPQLAQVIHWTGRKLHAYLKKELRVLFSYQTLMRFLKFQGYTFLLPRRWPAQQKPEQRKQFLHTISQLLLDPATELLFVDEFGISGDPLPRRRLARKGSKPRVKYYGKHIRASIIGAVQPASGEFFSLIFDRNNTQTFQCFLDFIAQETYHRKEQKKIILVLDNATWHKAKSLTWHHLQPLFLPPYSPDLNPIEELWKYIKEQFFADFIATSYQELEVKLCQALTAIMETPQTVSSVASLNCLKLT